MFLDLKKNLEISLSSVEKMCVVRAIFYHGHFCLYVNLTADFFDLAPPTVQEYFT